MLEGQLIRSNGGVPQDVDRLEVRTKPSKGPLRERGVERSGSMLGAPQDDWLMENLWASFQEAWGWGWGWGETRKHRARGRSVEEGGRWGDGESESRLVGPQCEGCVGSSAKLPHTPAGPVSPACLNRRPSKWNASLSFARAEIRVKQRGRERTRSLPPALSTDSTAKEQFSSQIYKRWGALLHVSFVPPKSSWFEGGGDPENVALEGPREDPGRFWEVPRAYLAWSELG